MTEREQAEYNRQEIILALMLLEGMTRKQAECEESRRFQRAVRQLFR